MKIIPLILCGLAFIASLGCQSKVDEGTEFFQVRLHRWTALEGRETFILRRVGNTWSGSLIGDGQRFSCFYQREAAPKVGDWKQLYEALVQAGILELSGKEPDLGWEDGNGYNLEVTANGKVSQYSVFLAEKRESVSAKRIQEVGSIVSTTFDTPMFMPDYDRGTVGEYLIDNCKDFRK